MDKYSLSLIDLSDLLGVSRQAVSQIASKMEDLGASVVKNKKQTTHLMPKTVREILLSRGYKYNKKTLAFQVIKGGVGKTTLAKNFGVRAAQYGYRVLFIDFDHQANLTFALNKFDPKNKVFVDYVRGTAKKISELVLKISDNISIIPSSLTNAKLDSELVTNAHNLGSIVKEPLEEMKKEFDLIVCDCPPALGPLVSSVYLGVEQVIAPMVPDKFSEMAIDFMLEEWGILSRRFKSLPSVKLIVNRHDPRLKASNEQLIHMVSKYKDYIYPTAIRASADFMTSTNSNEHLWEGKRTSSASEDVDLFVRHALNLSELTESKTVKKETIQEIQA